jgi:hypothetical protein
VQLPLNQLDTIEYAELQEFIGICGSELVVENGHRLDGMAYPAVRRWATPPDGNQHQGLAPRRRMEMQG